MRHTACSSYRQVKALFFILLLAGHDAVRVTQEVEWSKSKWNELHADCSWSLRKGCSEGCVRKRLPLDKTLGESCRHTNAYLLENNGLENYHAMIEILLEKSEKYSDSCQKASRLNRKCRRREAQMTEGLQFIIRAMNAPFMGTLDESEQATLNDVLEKVLKNLAKSQDEAESVAELVKKLKCQRSELLQDPKKALTEATGLGQALLSDNPDAKQQAKLQIEAMPESCHPVSAEQEAEGLVKLKDLQKEFEQEPGETSLVLDELDAAIDHVVEEEANETESASSALQVSLSNTSKAALAQKNFPPLVPFLLTTTSVVGLVTLAILAGHNPIGHVLLLAVATWATFSMSFCFIWAMTLDDDRIIAGDGQKCMKSMLLLPFKAVKGIAKVVAKGAWLGAKGAARLGKGIYKYFRNKGNTSNTSIDTSVLFETEDVMDELPELQAEPLGEVSAS